MFRDVLLTLLRIVTATQRTRVVVGEGTWHVRREDGGWYHDTVSTQAIQPLRVISVPFSDRLLVVTDRRRTSGRDLNRARACGAHARGPAERRSLC